MRSRPWKEHETVRLKIINDRLQALHGKRRAPRRIAMWSQVGKRWRLLTGHDTQHRTPAARKWRTVLRIKRLVSSFYRRREL